MYVYEISMFSTSDKMKLFLSCIAEHKDQTQHNIQDQFNRKGRDSLSSMSKDKMRKCEFKI